MTQVHKVRAWTPTYLGFGLDLALVQLLLLDHLVLHRLLLLLVLVQEAVIATRVVPET